MEEISRADGLTEQEGAVMDSLVGAWNGFILLEVQNPMDRTDFCNAINKCQDLLATRIARRLYPEGWPIK